MVKHRFMLTVSYNSPATLVFLTTKLTAKFDYRVTPSGDAKCRWGRLKSTNFDKWLALSRKRHKIDTYFLLRLNRRSYALY